MLLVWPWTSYLITQHLKLPMWIRENKTLMRIKWDNVCKMLCIAPVHKCWQFIAVIRKGMRCCLPQACFSCISPFLGLYYCQKTKTNQPTNKKTLNAECQAGQKSFLVHFENETIPGATEILFGKIILSSTQLSHQVPWICATCLLLFRKLPGPQSPPLTALDCMCTSPSSGSETQTSSLRILCLVYINGTLKRRHVLRSFYMKLQNCSVLCSNGPIVTKLTP